VQSTQLLEVPFLLQSLIEPDQSSMRCVVYQSVVYCVTVNGGEFISWLTFTWGLISSVWKLAIMKEKLVSKRLQSLSES